MSTLRLECASGPEGLARVKDYDPRFAFFPGFYVERAQVLEFRAEEIAKISKQVRATRLEAEGEHSNPASSSGKAQDRLNGLMTLLMEKMAKYGTLRLWRNIIRTSSQTSFNYVLMAFHWPGVRCRLDACEDLPHKPASKRQQSGTAPFVALSPLPYAASHVQGQRNMAISGLGS